ncbi:hypothetical protein EV178_004158 [Coemansia sp. RSA 1646]|nr:hypothetical protein EV178_004158 [Coemansia sp. RSA 1646]KAJ2088265.1 hypothetical protein IW138_004342 [Coemansia sp. RSA 986]
MDAASEIAPFPSSTSAGSIAGGIASGLWRSGHSDASILYRHTPRLLEIRSMAAPSLEGPEALATLSMAQLQTDTVEDLAIVLVKPVVLNNMTQLLVYAHEEQYKVGRLYVFNPFTLTVFSISAAVPYNACSLSVSTPLRAGSGTTTEWEFALVCFGLANSKALIGNLTVGADGAHITALEAFALEAGKHKVSSSVALEFPDGSNRGLVFLGLGSGNVVAVEYSPFGLSRGHTLGQTSTSSQFGPVTCLSATLLDRGRFVLCAGHSSVGVRSSGSAVATYVATLNNSSKHGFRLTFDSIGVDRVLLAPSDCLDGQQQTVDRIVANAEVIGLKIHDMRNTVPLANATTDAPTIVIAALACSSADDGKKASSSRRRSTSTLGSGMIHGLFNAWGLSVDGTLETRALSCQSIVGPDVILGMSVSGKLSQVEVVTDRKVFIGDSLLRSISSAGGVRLGDRMPMCTSKYLEVADRFAYSSQVRHALAEQRKQMGGELFIDILLHMAGIYAGERDGAGVYPPKTPTEQRRFIDRINSSDFDDLKKHCITYYLVLDNAAGSLVSSNRTYTECESDPIMGNSLATDYANEALIPRHFEYLMRGYWLMDHGQTAASIAYLSDPIVIADWAPKIISSAVSSSHFKEGLQFLNSTTAMSQPRIENQVSEASLVMEMLLHCDFGRAFTFQRKQTSIPDLRQVLLSQLFSFALSLHARRAVVDRLSIFPLDAVEEAALEDHCLHADTPTHAKDFLALYYVNRGRYAEAIRLFKDISKAEAGQRLDEPQTRKRNERATMVQNLTMLLPEAQRWVVEELEAVSDECNETPSQDQIISNNKIAAKAQSSENAERPWALEGDRVPSVQSSTATPSRNHSISSRQIYLNQPLSASKAARHTHAAVGTNGRTQNASRPLVRMLVSQLSTANPDPVQKYRQKTYVGPVPVGSMSPRKGDGKDSNPMGLSNVPETPRSQASSVFKSQYTPQDTPWKTPMTFISRSAAKGMSLRVPFSGPPSTPFRENNNIEMVDSSIGRLSSPFGFADDDRTPCRNVVGNAIAVESPLAVKNASGDLPLPIEASRSPFERPQANHSIENQLPLSAGSLQQQTTPEPKTFTKREHAPEIEESSSRRYNLRDRAGISSPATPSRSGRQLAKNSSKQAKDGHSISSKESARNYERALRQQMANDTNEPRGRKRG